MTFASDDLASVLVAPQREHTGYGQAILTSFNTETFENQVDYRGARLTNLPVLDTVGALTYQPGDVVLLMRWTPTGGGLSSYWIAGRPVIPGAGRAEQAIAWMSGSLARAVAAEVFADRIHVASVEGQQSTTSTSFTDLPTAGPTVADVEIVNAAVVFLNAGISGSAQGTVAQNGGAMSFQVTGATSVSADLNNSRSVQQGVSVGTMGDQGSPVTITRSASMTVVPLNPGLHTFTAKYRALGSTNATGTFNQRHMVVIAL